MADDSVAQDQLRAFVERIERIQEEIDALNADKSEIYQEAKGNGFVLPALRQVIKLRRMDPNERMELEAIVELYLAALGMGVAAGDDEENEPSRAGARPRVENIDDFRRKGPRLVAGRIVK